MPVGTTTDSSAEVARIANGLSKTRKPEKFPHFNNSPIQNMKNIISSINEDSRTISIDEFTQETISSIRKLQESARNDESVEFLFNKDGEFEGHLWGNRCGYSVSDLKANGHYKLDWDSTNVLEQILRRKE